MMAMAARRTFETDSDSEDSGTDGERSRAKWPARGVTGLAAAAVSASCWRRSYSVWASAMLPPVSEDTAAAGTMRGRLCGERAVARAGRPTEPRHAR